MTPKRPIAARTSDTRPKPARNSRVNRRCAREPETSCPDTGPALDLERGVINQRRRIGIEGGDMDVLGNSDDGENLAVPTENAGQSDSGWKRIVWPNLR